MLAEITFQEDEVNKAINVSSFLSSANISHELHFICDKREVNLVDILRDNLKLTAISMERENNDYIFTFKVDL